LCGYLKDEVRLQDVNPLTLGLELHNGQMEAIIRANEPIPIKRWLREAKALTTNRDGQESIRFRVVQGERLLATDNLLIGEVTLPLVAARPRGEARIHCLFDMDLNGILHLFAEDADTGVSVSAVFDRVYQLGAAEVEAKLQEGAEHRAEDELTGRVLRLGEELD